MASVNCRMCSSTALTLGHDILAIHQDRTIGAITQGDVQDGTVFGDVDLVAAEHSISPLLDLRVAGQIEQQRERFRQ